MRVSRVIRRAVLATSLQSTTSGATDVVDAAAGRRPPLTALLAAAVKQPDPAPLRCLLERHAVDADTELVVPPSAYRRRRTRPLHAALAGARRGLVDRVDALLDAGADPNLRDGRGSAPLHLAAAASEAPAARLLLARGARPDAKDRRGDTALHAAARHGHCPLVRALLDHSADQFVEDRDGLAAVHVAARAGNQHVVEMLCEADRRAVEAAAGRRSARRPIHLAAAEGHAETVSVLLERFSADVESRDADGNGPLQEVVSRQHRADRDRSSHYACAAELVRRGAAVNARNDAGQTALQLAADNQFPRIAQLLLASGARPASSAAAPPSPQPEAPPPSPPQKQRRVATRKSAEKLSAAEVETIAERIRKKPAPPPPPARQADDRAAAQPRPSSEKVAPAAAQKARKPSSSSSERTAAGRERLASDEVKLRRAQTAPSRPGVDNEISTFSVMARGSGERMCILLDQKPSAHDVDDRTRSRRSIEGEMVAARTSGGGVAGKLISVEIETDESADVDHRKPSAGRREHARKVAKGSSDAVRKRDRDGEKQKTTDRESVVESTTESDKQSSAEPTTQPSQPPAGDPVVGMQTDEIFFDPERGTQEWFGRPGIVSPVDLKDVGKLTPPGFRSTMKSPSGFISEGGGGARGLKLRVAGVVPKAYSRRQKDTARRAFFAARPVAIESIGDADLDDVSHVSMSSMPEMGYEAWERSVQRHKEWSEPLQPIHGRPPKHPRVGDLDVSFASSRSSPAPADDKVLIGPYAPAYRSTGPIDVRTDLIEEMLQDDNLSYDYDSMEWNDDDDVIPEPPLFDSVPVPPPEILDRHRAVEELLRTSPTDDGRDAKPTRKLSEKTSLPAEKMEEDRLRKAEMDRAFEEAKKKLSQKLAPPNVPEKEKSKHDKKKRKQDESVATSETATKLEEKERRPKKQASSSRHVARASHEVHFQEQELRTDVRSSTVVSSQSSTTKIERLTAENFVVAGELSSSAEESESEQEDHAAPPPVPAEKATSPAAVSPPQTRTTPVKGILKSKSKYDSRSDRPQQQHEPDKKTQQPVDAGTKRDERKSGLEGYGEEPKSADRRRSGHSEKEQSKVSQEEVHRRGSGKDRSRIPVPERKTKRQGGVEGEVTSPEPSAPKVEDKKLNTDEDQSTLPAYSKEPGSRRRRAADDLKKRASHTGPQEHKAAVRDDSERQTEDKTQLPVIDISKTTERGATVTTVKPAVTEMPKPVKPVTTWDEEYSTMEYHARDADARKRKPPGAARQRETPPSQDVDTKMDTGESGIDVEYSKEPGSRRRKPRDAAKRGSESSRSRTHEDHQVPASGEPITPTAAADRERDRQTAKEERIPPVPPPVSSAVEPPTQRKTETVVGGKNEDRSESTGTRAGDERPAVSHDHSEEPAARCRKPRSRREQPETSAAQERVVSTEHPASVDVKEDAVQDSEDVKPKRDSSRKKKARKTSKGRHDDVQQKKPDSAAVPNVDIDSETRQRKPDSAAVSNIDMDRHDDTLHKKPDSVAVPNIDNGRTGEREHDPSHHQKRTETRSAHDREIRLVTERPVEIATTSFDTRAADTLERRGVDGVERRGDAVETMSGASTERGGGDAQSYDAEPGSKRRRQKSSLRRQADSMTTERGAAVTTVKPAVAEMPPRPVRTETTTWDEEYSVMEYRGEVAESGRQADSMTTERGTTVATVKPAVAEMPPRPVRTETTWDEEYSVMEYRGEEAESGKRKTTPDAAKDRAAERRKKRDEAQVPSSTAKEDERRGTRENVVATDEQIHEVLVEKAEDEVSPAVPKGRGDSELMQHWSKGPVIRPDVWEEAMNDEPLACSDVVYDDVVIPAEEMDMAPAAEYAGTPTVATARKEKQRKPPLVPPRRERKKTRSPKLQVVKETSVDEEIEEKFSSESSSSSSSTEEEEQGKLSRSSSTDSSSGSSDRQQRERLDDKSPKESYDRFTLTEATESHGKPTDYDGQRAGKSDPDVEVGQKLRKETDVDEDFQVETTTEDFARDNRVFREEKIRDDNDERFSKIGTAATESTKKQTEGHLPTKISGKITLGEEDRETSEDEFSDYDIPKPGAATKDKVRKQTAVGEETKERFIDSSSSSSSEEDTSSSSDGDESEKDAEDAKGAADRGQETGTYIRPTPHTDEPTWRRRGRPELPATDGVNVEYDDRQKQILPPRSLEETRPTSIKQQKRKTKASTAIYWVQEAEHEYQRRISESGEGQEPAGDATAERTDSQRPPHDTDKEEVGRRPRTSTDIDVDESFEEWTSDEAADMKDTESPTKSVTERVHHVAGEEDKVRPRGGQSVETAIDDDIGQGTSDIQKSRKTRREKSYQETSFDDVEPETTQIILERTDDGKFVDEEKQRRPKTVPVPSSTDQQKISGETEQNLNEDEMFEMQRLKQMGGGRVKKARQRKRLSDSLFVDPNVAGDPKKSGKDATETKPLVVPAPADLEWDETHVLPTADEVESQETNVAVSVGEQKEMKARAIAVARVDHDVDIESAAIVDKSTVEDGRAGGLSKSEERAKKRRKEKRGGERPAEPTTLTFRGEQDVEEVLSGSDDERGYGTGTVTVPSQARHKNRPQCDDDRGSDIVEPPADGTVTLTLTRDQATAEDRKGRASRRKSQKESEAKKPERLTAGDAESRRREAEPTSNVDEVYPQKPRETSPERFDHGIGADKSAAVVEVERRAEDDPEEQVRKKRREKRRVERAAQPTSNVNQLAFRSKQGEVDVLSGSDDDRNYRTGGITVAQPPQHKNQPRYDDDHGSDVEEQPGDGTTSLTLTQERITAEDRRERTSRKKSQKDSETTTKSEMDAARTRRRKAEPTSNIDEDDVQKPRTTASERFDHSTGTDRSASVVETGRIVDDDAVKRTEKKRQARRRIERPSEPTSNVSRLTFSTEKGESEKDFTSESEDDDRGYRAHTVTVPHPGIQYRPQYDEDHESDVEQQPDDGTATLTVTQEQITGDDRKERTSQVRKKTTEATETRKSREAADRDTAVQKWTGPEPEPPLTESQSSASSAEEDGEDEQRISQPPGIDMELDDMRQQPRNVRATADDIIRETNLDELSDVSAGEEEAAVKPHEPTPARIDSRADSVEIKTTRKDDRTAGAATKSVEQSKKQRRKERRRVERPADPSSSQLTFRPEQEVEEEELSESDDERGYKTGVAITVPQPREKYRPQYDEDDDSDVEEPAEDGGATTSTLTHEQITAEDRKERISETRRKTTMETETEKTKDDAVRDAVMETRISGDSDEQGAEFPETSQPPPLISRIQREIEETNLDDEFELSDEELPVFCRFTYAVY